MGTLLKLMENTTKHQESEISIRVPYADTDQMGMVYYANYYVYFERGRTEWLREKGLEYRSLEEKGTYLPVIESSCRYRSPARYDDMLNVLTSVSEIGSCSLEFSYVITCMGKLIAEGKTKHPFVNRQMKPIRIPEEIQRILENKNGQENTDRG
jgi:acyl-CoA thioester hydrolase